MNNSPHDQPKKKSGSTDEDATESTPAPTPPGNSAPTNVTCSFCDKKLPLDMMKILKMKVMKK